MIHFLWSDPRSEKGKREEEDRERERERDKGKRKKSVVKSSKQISPALRGCITAVTDRVRALKRHFSVKQKCAPQFIHGTDITVFPHFLLFLFSFSFVFSRPSPAILLIPDSGNSETPGVHVLEK